LFLKFASNRGLPINYGFIEYKGYILRVVFEISTSSPRALDRGTIINVGSDNIKRCISEEERISLLNMTPT